MRLSPKFLLVFLSVFIQLYALGQSSVIQNEDNTVKVGVDEHLYAYLPDSIYLMGADSQIVNLKDIIDKPTIINFVYYRCPGICSPLMEGLADVMNRSDLVAGKDYQILTISFDPNETIDLGIRKKQSYLNLVDKNKRAEISKGWKFFVSDSASIARGTKATGFKYIRKGNDFVHAASVTVVSPDGKITRYLNGITFLPFDFKMAIIEASKGKSSPTINKVLQYCFSYDPEGHTYVLNVTKITGTLILFIAVVIFLILIFKPKRKT